MAQRPPLEVDLLRSFLSVEQTGSFSRAGEILGRSQPAISLQIKRLEHRAGVALFDRSRSGEVRLTPAGATLVRYAHEILALHDDALATLAAPAMKSRVRLGILEELGHTRLPQILRAFNRANPRGTPQIQVSLSNQLVNDLLQNRLDLAVVAGDRNYPQGVMAWSETVTWVASSAVPLAAAPTPPLGTPTRAMLVSPIGDPCPRSSSHAMDPVVSQHNHDGNPRHGHRRTWAVDHGRLRNRRRLAGSRQRTQFAAPAARRHHGLLPDARLRQCC